MNTVDSDSSSFIDRPTFKKSADIVKTLLHISVPVMLFFVGYMQLAEDQRAIKRWESLTFARVVSERIEIVLGSKDLSTKQDIEMLRISISSDMKGLSAELRRLSDKVNSTAELVKSGVIN